MEKEELKKQKIEVTGCHVKNVKPSHYVQTTLQISLFMSSFVISLLQVQVRIINYYIVCIYIHIILYYINEINKKEKTKKKF